MMSKRCAPSCPKYCNGHHNRPPVELLSARIFRLRIARGYSIYDLAMAAHVFGGTIYRLESGKPVDKRDLPALARALGVPLCRLVCGEHSCAERACDEERTPTVTLETVSNLARLAPPASVPRRRRSRRFGALRREIDAGRW